MTVFWSLATVMVVVALLFVLPPLLRKRELPAVSRDELNTEVIKAQLAELDADLAAGKLDQNQYATARTDLEAAGFASTVWRDTTAPAVAWYEAVSARLAASGPPTVGLHLIMGESTLPKLHNLGGSLRDGRIQAWQGVFSIA